MISVYSRVVCERPDNISLIYTFVFRPIANFTISPFVSLFGAVYTSMISLNKTEDVSSQRCPGKNSPPSFSGHPPRERGPPSNFLLSRVIRDVSKGSVSLSQPASENGPNSLDPEISY